MWYGEIFGLTALSNYFCEFVRTADEEVFYSASLITSAAPSAETASLVTPTHQTLRPSSPTTTLRNSIAAADQKLQEQRNRLKRNRKDHKSAITNIKKEVETLSNRLSSAGGSDDRQRQRAMQFNQNIRQADDAAADFALQIDSLGEIPEEDLEESATVKRAWQRERKHKNGITNEFDQAKAEVDRQLASIQSDINSTIQKRERLQLRQTRLNEQHERLITANTEGLHAKTEKQQKRLYELSQRASTEHQYTSNINSYERRTSDFNRQTYQSLQQIHQLEGMLQQAQLSVPTTPEGVLPGTNGMAGIPTNLSAFAFPHGNLGNVTPGSMRNGGRGRSSSMLSNISGFTDGFDDPASPPVTVLANPFSFPAHLNGRKDSNGSGSGSGSSSQSSSQRDPMSPVPKSLVSVGSGRSSTPLSPMSGR